MSRTDKDRPEWVIENDPTIPLIYRHSNHIWFPTEMNYCTIYDHHADYCTAYAVLTWATANSGQMPCVRYRLLKAYHWWKFPKADRLSPYRSHRRDFLKRQVKIYNSNHELHDDLDFMNDEVLAIRKDEASYSHIYKN